MQSLVDEKVIYIIIGTITREDEKYYNRSGYSLIELNRNEDGLLVYDLENAELDFGERGRVEISDWLTKR